MAQVNNHDVAGLYARINRFIEELLKSQSSGVSSVISFDQERLASYLNALDTYRGWVVGQPALDLPETNPRPIELEEAPVIKDIENENVNDVIRLLCLGRDELTNSQSARLGAGLSKFDEARLTAIVAKVRQFLVTYISKATPLDLPESSPQSASSGPGRLGINPQ